MSRDLCLHANVEELECHCVCTDCGLVLGDPILAPIDVKELEINGTGTHVAGGTHTLIGRSQLRIQHTKTKVYHTQPMLRINKTYFEHTFWI